MTSTLHRPLNTAGTHTDTVIKVPDLLGTLTELQGRAPRHLLGHSITTDIYAWLDVCGFDNEDKQEFWRDLLRALRSDLDEVELVMREWRITAEALSDPLTREILLGDSSAADYVEVERPA